VRRIDTYSIPEGEKLWRSETKNLVDRKKGIAKLPASKWFWHAEKYKGTG
jgi:hypothetical protein